MAKTLRSRIAAVAVTALGVGLLQAAPAFAGTVSATLSGPVRVSFTDGVRDAVPAQTFSFTPDADLAAGATNDVILEVTQAPTSSSEVTVVVGGKTAVDSLASAGTPSTNAALGASLVNGTAVTTSTIAISANAASGTYAGKITLQEAAAATVVINWTFTTTGKVAKISTDVASVNLPAVAVSGGAFVTSKTVTVSLLDANNAVTQPATGDTVGVSISDATNISLTAAGAASVTLSNANLADGKDTFTVGSYTATADSKTVTVAPAGVMPAQGVANVTLVATTVGYGSTTSAVTNVTAPTSASVIKAGTTAITKTADKSVTKYTFNVSGLEVGKAYKVIVTAVDAAGSDLTATINDVAGLSSTLYGIATSAGVDVTVTLGGTVSASDSITIDANGDADAADASDMTVTLASATYAVTVTTPVVTPSIQKTSATIVVAGKVADQFGNPLQGATVTATGTQTLSSGTAANLVVQGTTATDGTYSVTLPAANALATSVSVVASAVKTGAGSITSASAYVVNLNAAGSADTITGSLIGDEDTATTATTYPVVVVPYTGRAKGISDELYTVANAAADGTYDATDGCIEVTATTSPAGQIVATGSTGVLFYSAACSDASTSDVVAGKSTVTVASTGSANLWVTSTKTGLNTFTITSGGVSKTYKFYAYNALTSASSGDAARNVSLTSTLALKGGEVGRVTATVTDAFGNPVVVAATATFTATITGGAMLDGPAISKSFTTTDANGQITLGVIAGAQTGTATVTVTGASAQFGAAAGVATGTTAGTNGLTASVKSATSAVTVTGDSVIATQVTSLTTTVAAIQTAMTALVASITSTLTLMQAQIAKIMKKLNIK